MVSQLIPAGRSRFQVFHKSLSSDMIRRTRFWKWKPYAKGSVSRDSRRKFRNRGAAAFRITMWNACLARILIVSSTRWSPGDADYSLLPVENALAGSVSGAYEMLLDHDVRIQAEVILHVHHALLGTAGTSLERYQASSLPPASLDAMRKISETLQHWNLWDGTIRLARHMTSPMIRNRALGVIATELAAELYGSGG